MRNTPAIPLRWSTVALLALAGTALAADAPAPAPTPVPAEVPNAAPPGATAPAPASLEEIEETYDGIEEEATKSVRRRRYDAILHYVRTNPAAKDVQAATAALFLLADGVEMWDRALVHADEYLAAWPAGKDEVAARFSRARALAEMHRGPEAKAAFESLTAMVNLPRHGKATVVAAWTFRARHLAEQGDTEGAKAAWRGLKAAVAASPDASAYARTADGEIAALDLLGKPVRPFPADARDLEGRQVAIGDYAGKVLLLDFWATWCGPCKQDMPGLVEAWKKWHDRGFEVLGICMDGLNEGAKVRALVASQGLPWKNVYYTNGRNPIGEGYDVRALPHTLLIGRDGRFAAVGARGKELTKAIEEALKK